MHLLFEKSHPKDLVEALKAVHQTDNEKGFTLTYYDNNIAEPELQKPVIFVFDYSKKGLDPTTEQMYEDGFRIIAFKTKREEKLNFFDFSLTMLGLWPKVIKLAKEIQQPFIYTYKYSGTSLKKVRC